MSFIIDQAFKNLTSKIHSKAESAASREQPTVKKETFRDTFWWHMQKFIIENSFSAKIIHAEQQTYIQFLEMSFTPKITAVFILKLANSNQHSVVCIDLLNKSHQFCTVPNRNKRILVNKELLNCLFRGKYNFLTPMIDLSNGRVVLVIRSTLLFREEILRQKDFNQSRLFFDRTFKFLINEVGSAVKYISNLIQNDCISGLKGEVEPSRTLLLKKYIQLMTMKKELPLMNAQTAQWKVKEDQFQQCRSVKRIKENFISFRCSEFSSAVLFSSESERESQVDFTKPLIDQEEDRYFVSTLNANLQDKNRNNMINVVQATIFIKDPQNIRLVPFRGSSNIFLADTQFWYVCSGALGNDGNPENYDQRNIFRKQLLLKKESSLKNGVRYFKNVNHQKQIIREMRNSHSLLINKYYQSSNQPNIFSKDLLMEFLPFPTLAEFIVLNKHSLSLTTKMHFIFSIVQALRSLARYNIAHMDLKPNNILTHYFNTIRLVDFGQSYHPLVCSQNYKPGFTQPYCAPEILHNDKKFTIKYDVFSLGIIISELVFYRYPFFLFRDSSLESYRSKKYLRIWLGCPEESQSFGQHKLTNILWSVVNRCLQDFAENRPEVNVLAIIFQLALQIMF